MCQYIGDIFKAGSNLGVFMFYIGHFYAFFVLVFQSVTQRKILEVNPVSRGCLDGNRNDSNPCDDPSFAAICPLGVETRQNISR